MSCAWPLFQVNLWGVFDHIGDLNDHLVIERRNRVLNRHPGSCGWKERMRKEGRNEMDGDGEQKDR